MSRDILVFSAPFWRVNGLLWFFVQQLPLGVSHGVFQVIGRDEVCVVRSRVSLLWLRVNTAAIPLLLLAAALASGPGEDAIVLWTLFVLSIVAGGAIYAAAVFETRRYFKKLLLDARNDSGETVGL